MVDVDTGIYRTKTMIVLTEENCRSKTMVGVDARRNFARLAHCDKSKNEHSCFMTQTDGPPHPLP